MSQALPWQLRDFLMAIRDYRKMKSGGRSDSRKEGWDGVLFPKKQL
jgi:hypothetical protein